MDPETALELVKHGVTILLLDVPQYTLVGIDTQMFSAGPSFKGIKMIPPGPHFLYYSSSSRDGREFPPITGFFVDAGPSEVIVRRWDQREERLIKVLEKEPFCTRSQLFTKFIKVIYHQLKFGLEKDRSNDKAGSSSILIDESWFSADSFLHHLCKDFFSLVLEAPVVDGDLLTWTRKLKELLENRLGWKFHDIATDGISFDEDDEFAPVVVRMDESESS